MAPMTSVVDAPETLSTTSIQTFQRGKLLEQLLLTDNLVILNTGEITHVCMATGSMLCHQ